MDWTLSEAKTGAALARQMGLDARAVARRNHPSYVRLNRVKGDTNFYPLFHKWMDSCRHRSIDCEHSIVLCERSQSHADTEHGTHDD